MEVQFELWMVHDKDDTSVDMNSDQPQHQPQLLIGLVKIVKIQMVTQTSQEYNWKFPVLS